MMTGLGLIRRVRYGWEGPCRWTQVWVIYFTLLPELQISGEVPEIQKRHPFHFPLQKWFIQTKIKNVLKVHTLNAHPLCPSPENLGKGPYLHLLLAKFLQPLKPSLPFREYGFVPHTAGSCNGFSLLSRNDSRKTTK